MTNGTTARQKILDLLVSQSEAITKKTIANQTHLSETTIDLNCTELRRAGYIDTGNGGWWVTAHGREQHSIDPNIGAFHVKQAAETDSRVNWAELLGYEATHHPLCRDFLEKPPRELLAKLQPYLPFFVIAWLVTEGIENNLDPSVEFTADTDKADLVVNTINYMLEEIHKQNTVNIDFEK